MTDTATADTVEHVGPTVDAFGQTFRLSADGVSEFAILEFAEAAADGQDGDTMQGMASMLRLIRDCIHTEDWLAFRDAARQKRAKVSDLTPILQTAMQVVADRPTGRPSDSSDGPSRTQQSSESQPDATVTDLLTGRPDLQLMVQAEKAARSA